MKAQYLKNLFLTFGFAATFGLSPLMAQDYFWVGDSGNWSDLSHWATSSGGSETHDELPGPENDVYFDEQSFTMPGQQVTFDVAQGYCRDFNTAGVQHNPLFKHQSYSNALRPYGDVFLDPGLQRDFGNIVMSNEFGVAQITTSEISLGTQCILLFGSDEPAEFHLVDSVSVKSLGVSRGQLHTNGHPVNCSWGFNSNYGPYREMYLYDSNIYCSDAKYNSNMLMDADEASFYFDNSIGVWGDFQGAGFEYGYVAFTGEVNLSGNNTFNEFRAMPGTEIILDAGSVQTAGQFYFDGTLDNPIQLISSVSGEQASIMQTSGTVDGTHMIIRDNNASGGATFTADNSIDLGNNIGWNIIENLPANYYWVGGNGNWSDLSHWATTSGGSETHADLPTVQDTVIIDSESMNGGGAITIDIAAFCADWKMHGSIASVEIIGDELLNVYGNFELHPNTEAEFSEVYFKGGEGPYEITSNGVHWGTSCIIEFQVGGEYVFTDDLLTYALRVDDGTVHASGISVEVDWEIRTQAAGNPFLNLSGSDVLCANWRPYAFDPAAHDVTNTIFEVTNQFHCELLSYDEVLLSGSEVTLYGTGAFSYLELTPGMQLNMESGSVFVVNQLVAIGTPSESIVIRSTTEGEEAYFEGYDMDVMGEYLDLQDNHGTGSIDYVAMYSVLGSNVEGWFDPTTGVDERHEQYSVFPNPVSTVLNIELFEAGIWELIDLSGRQVLAPKQYYAGLNRIDVSELPGGQYFMRNIKSPFSTVKVVKE